MILFFDLPLRASVTYPPPVYTLFRPPCVTHAIIITYSLSPCSAPEAKPMNHNMMHQLHNIDFIPVLKKKSQHRKESVTRYWTRHGIQAIYLSKYPNEIHFITFLFHLARLRLRLPFTPASLISLQMRPGCSRTRMQARAGPEPPLPELLPHHLVPERRPRCPEGRGVRRVHELDQRILRQPDSNGLRRGRPVSRPCFRARACEPALDQSFYFIFFTTFVCS